MIRFRNVFIIACIAFLFSLCLAKPKLAEIRGMLYDKECLWRAIEVKRNDLTSNLEMFKPNSGEAKYVFRLTVPVLMKVFSIPPAGMRVLQVILGFGIFFFWALLASTFVSSYRHVLFITLCLAGVYYGKAFNIDSSTPVNTLSYFLILFCIYFRNSVPLAFIGLSALFFNDERGILAYAIIGLYILYWDSDKLSSIKQILTNKAFITLVATFVVCVAVRLLLTVKYGMRTETAGVTFSLFMSQWKYYQLGVFSGLVGFTAIFGYGIYHSIVQRNYLFAAGVIFIILMFLAGTGVVADMTKTIACLTPLSLILLKKAMKFNPEIITVNNTALIVNAVFPTLVIVGDAQFYYYNVTFDLLFKIFSLL